jgi:hypothetical protein
MNQNKDHIGNILVFILIILLAIAGYFSYKSIDWQVLNRIESQTLSLPTQTPTIPSTEIQTSTPSSSTTK